MHPFEKETTALPRGVSSHLEVRLKPGWRFDRRRRALISEAGQSVRLRGVLSPGIRIVPIAPSLAAADPGSLSEDERLLARYLQVVLPSGGDPADVAADLRSLEGVELVTTPPKIGLP
ncbi:MAG: hypothetical protein JO112_14670 [Planctomycetes bacterium]|nr:hypothetical protein [Planctomycetota bacterium]